jgi:hypothetical protein
MGEIALLAQTTPQLPQSGKVKFYVDSADNHFKQVDSSGNIIDLTDTALITRFLMINNTGVTITKGSVVKLDSFDDINNEEEMILTDASDSDKMPGLGIVEADTLTGNTGFVTIQGNVTGLNTSSFSEGDELFISTTPGGLTNTRPTGSALIQKIGTAGKIDATVGTIVVNGASRVNALPNLAEDLMWRGDVNGIPQPVLAIPPNLRLISVKADLPTPVAGVIQLEDNINYLLVASVDIGTDRFVTGTNNNFTARNTFFPILSSTTTGTLFTGVDSSFSINQLTVDCPNAQFMDFSSPTSLFGNIVSFFALGVLRCQKVGVVNNLLVCEILRSAFVTCTDGITVLGTTNWSVFSYSTVAFGTSSAAFVGTDFSTSLHQSLVLENAIMRAPAGAVGITGAANSANLRANEIAIVSNGEFSGGLTPLSVIANDDIRWEFLNNGGIPDSEKTGDTFLTTPETVTNPGIGVFSTIGGGNWQSEVANRFTVTNDGEITYISERTADFSISAIATVEKVGGGSDQIALRIAKNLSAVAKTESVTQNATPTSLTCQGLFSLETGDVIELGIANNTSTSDIIVDLANLIIRGSS